MKGSRSRGIDMSKRHKMNRNDRVITPPRTNRRTALVVGSITLVVVTLIGLGLRGWVGTTSDFDRLQGRWVRTDGGYVLEVREVTADGRMDAAYLNPDPIHVSKAEASSEAGQTQVFVELRDRLYPGSYYTLTYDGGKDQLAGLYHHLGIQQEFDVIFARIK